MATLGSGVLMLSATADGFQKDLKKAGGSVTEFNAKVKAVPEIGEKIMASFGRISQVGSVFTLMNSDASALEKTIAGVNVGVGGLTVGLQLATKVTTGLKAALLGTGIGAIIVGLGYIVGKLTSARAEEKKEREEWQKFLDRVERTATRTELPAPRRGAWDLVSFDEARADRTTDAIRRRSLEARETLLRPVAELAMETGRFADSMDEMARSVGHSRDEMILLGLEARRAAMAMDPFLSTSESYARVVADIGRARWALYVAEGRREIERLRTPLEVSTAEIERLAGLLRRGGGFGEFRFDSFRRGILGMLGDSPTADPVHDRIELTITAFRRFAEEHGRIARMVEGSPLLRMLGLVSAPAPLGGDARGIIDRLAAMAGETSGPLTALRARIATIDRASEAAREAAFRGGVAFDVGRFDRTRAAALLDAERSLGAVDRAAPQAFLEGSADAISAINAARRNAVSSDPIVRVESVLRRLERIEEDERARLTEIARALDRVRRI